MEHSELSPVTVSPNFHIHVYDVGIFQLHALAYTLVKCRVNYHSSAYDEYQRVSSYALS
jgi:hypothetical protein